MDPHKPGIRDALDSLIHGGEVPRARSDAAGGHDAIAPASPWSADLDRRGTGFTRSTPEASTATAFAGLMGAAAWADVIAAEEARLARFRRPSCVVQAEVKGISSVAGHLGGAFAERLLIVLSEALQQEGRQSDLYARPTPWRIQGILPEQEEAGGARFEERMREVFVRRVGPEAPFGLLIGTAAVEVSGGFQAAFKAAEREMRLGVTSPVGAARMMADPGTGVGRSNGVHDGLVELERLRAEDLITDDEFLLKRAEILARL